MNGILPSFFKALRNSLKLPGFLGKTAPAKKSFNFSPSLEAPHQMVGTGYSRAMKNRISKRRAKNQMARKSRRVNQLRLSYN